MGQKTHPRARDLAAVVPGSSPRAVYFGRVSGLRAAVVFVFTEQVNPGPVGSGVGVKSTGDVCPCWGRGGLPIALGGVKHFFRRVFVGGGMCVFLTCFYCAFCTAAPISLVSTMVLWVFPSPSDASPATVLALEEIKRGLTCFCLQLLSCLAGLLTPIWEEQTREQLCLLLGSAGAA